MGFWTPTVAKWTLSHDRGTKWHVQWTILVSKWTRDFVLLASKVQSPIWKRQTIYTLFSSVCFINFIHESVSRLAPPYSAIEILIYRRRLSYCRLTAYPLLKTVKIRLILSGIAGLFARLHSSLRTSSFFRRRKPW